MAGDAAATCGPPDAELQVPANATDQAIRCAIGRLDPERRLGAASEPVFLEIWVDRPDGPRLSFLGLTAESESWLATAVGADVAAAHRDHLRLVLPALTPAPIAPGSARQAGGEAFVDAAEQVVAAFRALRPSCPPSRR